jgi:hypothetical protein
MFQVKQSTAKPFSVFMGVAGLTVTATISKNGGTFGAATSPTITDRSNGFYSVTPDAADRGTLGELAWLFAASGATSIPRVEQIVAFDPEIVPPTAVQISEQIGTDIPSESANWVAAVQHIIDSIRTELTPELERIDTEMSGIAEEVLSGVDLSGVNPEGTLADYVAYVKAVVALIQAKTDQLTFTVANRVDASPLSEFDGPNAVEYTDTVVSGGDPVEGADVWLTPRDAVTPIIDRTTTNSLGSFTLRADPGDYDLKVQRTGYESESTAITIPEP